ncbi:MAG: LysR family transcriptional regulator [Desulfatiglandales bacterium]
MLNLNQLRVFYHVGRNKSITVAAQELMVTQPAVTAQIKFLEDACDLKLFKKKGRHIELTEEGKSLYLHVKKLFDLEKEIEGVIEDMKGLKCGTLRIGTSTMYARYRMSFLISTFHYAYPKIKVCLYQGSSAEVMRSLFNLDIDLAIVAHNVKDPKIISIPFRKEPLLVIVPKNHRLAENKIVTLEDLMDEPLIMREVGSSTRGVVDELFARNNITPRILMETSNAGFIKQIVGSGGGVAFLVKEAVRKEVQEGKIIALSLKGEEVGLEVSISYHREVPLSPAAQAFLRILQKLAGESIPFEGMGYRGRVR